MKGFNVLNYGLNRIYQISKRNDFKIRIIEQYELDKFKFMANVLILSLEGDSILLYQKPAK
jgi:hypothetical protein